MEGVDHEKTGRAFWRGAMVVEASYLFLLIFLVFAVIVCEGAYLHDCYILYAKAQKCAVDVTKEVVSDVVDGKIDLSAWKDRGLLWQVTDGHTDQETKAKKILMDQANEGLLFSQKIDAEVAVRSYEVEVKYHLKYSMPLMNVFYHFHLTPPRETTITAVAGYVEQEEFLRLLHSLFMKKKA
ncbi:MAG: hypothetical protein IKX10_02040 [Lachnospiraceae bacterium]|nr:hypothetical protein [Lachnospiraceae bacterium]